MKDKHLAMASYLEVRDTRRDVCKTRLHVPVFKRVDGTVLFVLETGKYFAFVMLLDCTCVFMCAVT